MLGDKLVALRKKNGYSQQELADKLNVTRQTISNWELGQGAPSLDKAMELAKIYHVSLDDLAENQVEIVTKEKKQGSSRLLKCLEGKKVKISGSEMELLLESGLDRGHNAALKVLEVNDEWMHIEYARTKENHLMKKETVVKLIDIDMINGVETNELPTAPGTYEISVYYGELYHHLDVIYRDVEILGFGYFMIDCEGFEKKSSGAK